MLVWLLESQTASAAVTLLPRSAKLIDSACPPPQLCLYLWDIFGLIIVFFFVVVTLVISSGASDLLLSGTPGNITLLPTNLPPCVLSSTPWLMSHSFYGVNSNN